MPKGDRRMMFYNCNSEVANDKVFFDALYSEFDDLDVMKSAFDFFMSIDITDWDYRKFPSTELREKLIQCSSGRDDLWLNELFHSEKYAVPVSGMYCFSCDDLWRFWNQYAEDNGIRSLRDKSFIVSNFELRSHTRLRNGRYSISFAKATNLFGE